MKLLTKEECWVQASQEKGVHMGHPWAITLAMELYARQALEKAAEEAAKKAPSWTELGNTRWYYITKESITGIELP